jgi:hypothetical protein
MSIIRILVILISAIFALSVEASFAASGSGTTATGNTTIKIKEIDKIEKDADTHTDTGTEEEKIAEQKTEKNAQKIILEVYKIQGNKILKDMDVSIEKVNSDPKIRIDIYSSIQKTLELRKQKVEK